MKTCSKCLNQVEDDSKFCPFCWNQLSDVKLENAEEKRDGRFCKNCGKEVSVGFISCPFCGANMITGNVTQGLNSNRLNRSCSDNIYLRSKNHTSSFVLGLLGTILVAMNYLGVFFVHIIGLILGIIGLSLASKDKKEEMTYSKAGYVLSMIAVIGGALAFLIGMIYGLINA